MKHDGLIQHEAAVLVARLCGLSREEVAGVFALAVEGVEYIERRYCTDDGSLRPGARELLQIPSALRNTIA